MVTYNQICLNTRASKIKKSKTPALDQCPQKKGICLKLLVKTPKKPNSALRKLAKVKLSNKKIVYAYIPGEGHNLQIYSTILMRGGRIKDLPGVKYHLIWGKFDFNALKYWKTARSKYGTKKFNKYV